MAHRIGICGSCKARFQIPATFAPSRAKCRNCGGVVAIGPVEGEPEKSPALAAPPPPSSPPPPRAPEPPPPAPAPIEPSPAPSRGRGVVKALVVLGIAAALAIGLWTLLS